MTEQRGLNEWMDDPPGRRPFWLLIHVSLPRGYKQLDEAEIVRMFQEFIIS